MERSDEAMWSREVELSRNAYRSIFFGRLQCLHVSIEVHWMR